MICIEIICFLYLLLGSRDQIYHITYSACTGVVLPYVVTVVYGENIISQPLLGRKKCEKFD
jgi:hypothetical protein